MIDIDPQSLHETLPGRYERGAPGTRNKDATSNKCIASSNKCLTSSNKKLLETSALLLGTKTLLGPLLFHLSPPSRDESHSTKRHRRSAPGYAPRRQARRGGAKAKGRPAATRRSSRSPMTSASVSQ